MPFHSISHRSRPSRIASALVTLAVLGCTSLAAVDLSQPVDVPDDIGLGERLALVAWLGDHKIPVPDPNDLPALRLAYLKRAHPEVLTAGQPTPEEEKRRGELAAELYRKHGVNPPAGATAEAITALIKKMDDDAAALQARDQAKASADGPAPTRRPDEPKIPKTTPGPATAKPAPQAPPAVQEALTPADEKKAAERAAVGIVIGKRFPGIDGRAIDGSPISLGNWKGKVVLIDFWATWCGPCMRELPNVKNAYATYHGQGFEVLGISLDVDKAQLRQAITAQAIPWPQLFDGGGWDAAIARQCAVHSIPTTFLIGRDGTLVAADLRGAALSEAIAKALAKEP
jgi:peroxiredoxin